MDLLFVIIRYLKFCHIFPQRSRIITVDIAVIIGNQFHISLLPYFYLSKPFCHII